MFLMYFDMIQYPMNWDQTLMLKKNFSDKINGIKNALFFGAPTAHHSFTFDSWFLNGLKHKFRLSESVCRILYFQFRFVFIKL